MDVTEINTKILLDVSDMVTLQNLCESNKTSYHICKKKSFWKDKYDKEGLPFYQFHKTLRANFLEYKYILDCNIVASYILENLIVGSENNHFIRIYFESPDNVKKFNNDNITELVISMIYDDIEDNHFIDISYENNGFLVNIPGENNNFFYDEKDMYYILFDIVYKGIKYTEY